MMTYEYSQIQSSEWISRIIFVTKNHMLDDYSYPHLHSSLWTTHNYTTIECNIQYMAGKISN